MNLYSSFDRNQNLKCESFSSSETHGTIKLGFRKIVFKFAVAKKMKPLIIMEGSNNESECAGIPEQSQGIVHNFVDESCMH